MNDSNDRAPLLIRLSNWFLPADIDDDEGLKRRARMLLAFHGLAVPILLWTAFYQISFGWKEMGLSALFSFPIVLLIPTAMKLGAPVRLLTSVGVLIFYATTLGITLVTGGKWPGGLFFLVLVPAVAVLLVGRRSGLRWSVITVASIAFASWSGSSGLDLYSSSVPTDQIDAARFRIAALLALGVFAMAHFYSSLHDRAVEALNQTVEKFQRGERRFKAIAEYAYDLIIELDETGRVLYASPGIEESLGWTPDEIQGHSMMGRIHPDDASRAQRYWEQLLEKSVVKQDAIRYESKLRGWRWLEISMRCYESNETGRRVVTVVRDATERFEREKLIRQQQNLVTVGTMAAGIAHQLNNPIGSILSSAQYGNLYKWNPSFGDIAGDSLDSIEQEAKNCQRAVRSLLSFARQERSEHWIESLDLVVRRAAAAVESQDATLPASLLLTPCREATPVLMGPIEIEQALINVIRNAFEAGATRVRVDTEIWNDETVSVTISDNGTGMTSDVAARAFEPFFTTHPDSGSGLGLGTARSILEEHDGQLTLLETSSEGSVFLIELPLAQLDAPPA